MMPIRLFQLLCVFRITSALQNLSVSQENKKKGQEKKTLCFTPGFTQLWQFQTESGNDICMPERDIQGKCKYQGFFFNAKHR